MMTPEKRLYNLEYRKKNLERIRNKKREYNRNRRIRVLSYYGGRCVCCGEDEPKFLAIDHINNDGAVERKQRKEKSKTDNICEYLLANKFPTGFQILCHNCNMAKAFFGKCPHEKL